MPSTPDDVVPTCGLEKPVQHQLSESYRTREIRVSESSQETKAGRYKAGTDESVLGFSAGAEAACRYLSV